MTKFILIFVVFIFCASSAFATQKKNSVKKIKLKDYSTNTFLLNNIELFLNFSLFTNETNFKAIKILSLTNKNSEKDKKDGNNK